MRAAVVTEYGGPEVVQVQEVPRPSAGRGEVLVRVEAVAVTSGDARIRGARFPAGFAVPARLAFGLRRPRRPVLGSAFSGVVEAVGPGVTSPVVGDAVCGMTGLRLGAHAEHVVQPAAKAVPVPAGVSHDDAAGVLFGGTTALHFVRGRVRPGTTVLVIGASGAVGTNAVQLARHLGGVVTGVTSGANAALVRDLGATHVVDRTQVDVTTLDERYDVVLDAVGVLSIPAGRRLLRPGGTLLLVVAGLADTLRARGDVVSGSSGERVEDMAELLGMVAAGDLVVVHDRAYGLDDVVEAHRRVDTGRKVGNVLLHPRLPSVAPEPGQAADRVDPRP